MIVIDTNVLLAFFLTNGITRRIIVQNPDVFMSPEHCYEELWEHRDRWNKNKLSDTELLGIVCDVSVINKLYIRLKSRRSALRFSDTDIDIRCERRALSFEGGNSFYDAPDFYKYSSINFWRFAEIEATAKTQIFHRIAVNHSMQNETADERPESRLWRAHPRQPLRQLTSHTRMTAAIRGYRYAICQCAGIRVCVLQRT